MLAGVACHMLASVYCCRLCGFKHALILIEGACTPDASKPCPLGWLEDVNHDCLAPAGYSGRCVGRKNFEGMRKTEKKLWADRCDVTWWGLLLCLCK